MNQQPDKFFREKLEEYQKPVQPSAWNKVEANLDKKNGKLFWLKIAAGLTILLSASVFLILKNQPQRDMLSQKMQTDAPAQKNIVDSTTKLEKQKNATEVAEHKIVTRIKSKATNQKNKKRNKEFTPSVVTPDVLQDVPVLAENKNNITITDNTTAAPVEPENTQVIAAQQTVSKNERKSITLIYAVEEVNEKYLDKKSLAEATHEEKKPSTFKKLLDKAYDLKYNQDAIGELRQKKNEILALNFKNEKQRSQNR